MISSCNSPSVVKAKRDVRRLLMGVSVALALVGCASHAPLAPVASSPSPSADTPAPKRPPKFGLALGGGAARGFAHVGVIQVLEEAGLRPTWSSVPRRAVWWPRCMPVAKQVLSCNKWPRPWRKPPSPIGPCLCWAAA